MHKEGRRPHSLHRFGSHPIGHPLGLDYQVSREFGGPMSILRPTSVRPRPARDFPAILSPAFVFLAFFLGAFFFLTAMRPHFDLGPMDKKGLRCLNKPLAYLRKRLRQRLSRRQQFVPQGHAPQGGTGLGP